MAPYGRNLEASEEFDVALRAGRNEIRIWFDDLAERDARYYFQLDYVSGPAAGLALPIPIAAADRRRDGGGARRHAFRAAGL